MRDIALAILSVGLCFYSAYYQKVNGRHDLGAECVAILAATIVLLP